MSPPLQLRFVLSAPNVAALPGTTAEVAFVGRSNVGKSSLINALGNRRAVAHVSKTPGRTQLLNLYEVTPGRSVVDLPGYGYAAVSRQTRAGWPRMISSYLLERENLRNVLVLLDGEIGPTKLDLEMLAWLRSSGVVHTLIATKHDKVKSSLRLRRVDEVAGACEVDKSEVSWVSATKGTGIEKLRGLVLHCLAAD